MVLIFSIDGDLSTDIVISWLKQYNHPYIRINAKDLLVDEVYINFNEEYLNIGNKEILFSEIQSIWYRRFSLDGTNELKKLSNRLDFEIASLINKEFTSISNGIINMLRHKRWLTHPDSTNLNKISVLQAAKIVGLDVPLTLVSNNKENLITILSQRKIITKSAYSFKFLHSNKGVFTMYTSRISEDELNDFPLKFSPSMLQEEIKKMYEIRTFFLVDNFYSMAIFSQQNKQTALDFRRYAWDRPNRYVPYRLPIEVEKKLRKLLKKINLNCASLDIIRGVNGKYYFIEINPVGQFGMVDFPCNYGLHKKIAMQLIKWDLN